MGVLHSARSAGTTFREVAAALVQTRKMEAKHSARPPASGLVLDVGGGESPSPRADVVVDRYLVDDFERGSQLALTKPLVIANGQALPFADNAFAYVVASHVLEHATDPELFAAELSRVGEAGFVQVPTRAAELTFGWRFHPWLVERSGDTLIFNPRGDAVAPEGRLFHDAMGNSRLFGLWFASNRDIWHHSVHWQGSIDVETRGTSQALQTAELDVEQTLAQLRKLAIEGRVQGPGQAIREALRCPHDRGALSLTDSAATCLECGRVYPVAGGVPVLLTEAAQPTQSSSSTYS